MLQYRSSSPLPTLRQYRKRAVAVDAQPCSEPTTLDRGLTAAAGDWIITSGQRRWPVAGDIFIATYEHLAGSQYYYKTAPIDAVQIHEPFSVMTLEGIITADAGDWLVRGVQGELWSITNDVFSRDYTLVSSASQ